MTEALADDVALLRQAASGDAGAFTTFLTRHQAGVWRRAVTLTNGGADAEDLLQETFLAAWRGAGGFRGGSARAWLLTIAGHAWQRMGRRGARVDTIGDEESLEALALQAGWALTDDSGGNDRADTVRAAFVRLSPDDRRLLTLRDIDGLPGPEAAELLGLSVPAMKSRLHRARLRLAVAFEEVRRGSA